MQIVGCSIANIVRVVSIRTLLCALSFACELACAAALVPVPGAPVPLPVGGLEPNRGQAKPGILFLNRGLVNVAVTAQSILYSPLGVQQTFVASNSNPTVSLLDPLPSIFNSFTGADTRGWVTGIPRYATVQLAGIYPGIDARYVASANGDVTLKLICAPGVSPSPVVFEIVKAKDMLLNPNGELAVNFGSLKFGPFLHYEPPTAFQGTGSSRVSRTVKYAVQEWPTRFGFEVDGLDASTPLEIDLKIPNYVLATVAATHPTVDNAGNRYVAVSLPDAAGKDAPFPELPSNGEGCSPDLSGPVPCADVAVYKFSKSGDLIFATYLAGKTSEAPTFVGNASTGELVVTGNTNSSNFPSTASAFQPAYAGPAVNPALPYIEGDYFAAKLDSTTGALLASTFFGGPNADSIGETGLGLDGSLYFFPNWLASSNAQMPVSGGALQGSCPGDPCSYGYAAHLSPSLDHLLYGTYLPGDGIIGKLQPDGSVYFAGSSGAGFPTTPGAYQPQPAGGYDGIIARLNPQGSGLIFGTYIGGTLSDVILRMAVAPDGSVWGRVNSFVECCVDVAHRLVHLDSTGSKLLADKAIDTGDLAVDPEGNLIATADGSFTVGPDAFLANACGPAYVKLDAAGGQLFATYLPSFFQYDFVGTSAHGTPLLGNGNSNFEVVERESTGVFAGCVVDGASFGSADSVSPGAMVTLFGSRMGPVQGVEFQLESGVVPTTLAGTRVLVNGEPVPVLYSSYWQVNVILPYSLPLNSVPTIQVESDREAGNALTGARVASAGISIFRADPSPNRPAAGLNQDGTVNSPQNPAKPGSVVMLFGTGGGATVPPSVAGEVTPVGGLRLLERQDIQVQITNSVYATVEYAGAAPGLLAGVTQLNVRLPETIPVVDGIAEGLVPLIVESPASFYPGYVTVAVK